MKLPRKFRRNHRHISSHWILVIHKSVELTILISRHVRIMSFNANLMASALLDTKFAINILIAVIDPMRKIV